MQKRRCLFLILIGVGVLVGVLQERWGDNEGDLYRVVAFSSDNGPTFRSALVASTLIQATVRFVR